MCDGLVQDGVLELLKSAVAALAIIAQISVALPANAILYSPDTNVPRTGELALRRAIPSNPSMKTIQVNNTSGSAPCLACRAIADWALPLRFCAHISQESLEDISYLLRIPQRKPYGSMEGDVKKAMKVN
jgi:hypothetical protein